MTDAVFRSAARPSRGLFVAVVLTALFALIVISVSVAGGTVMRPQSGLWSVVAAIVSALVLGLLFEGLRSRGWTALSAMPLLALFAGGSGFLYLVTAAPAALPLMLLCALLVAVTRGMESAGDVQAQLSFGLVVAMLPLVNVFLVPLALPLIVAGALADRDARRSVRIFLSLLLVLAVPSLIVAGGMLFAAIRSGAAQLPFISADYWRPIAPHAADLAALDFASLRASMLLLLLPMIACFAEGGRNRMASALLVAVLPLYLAAGSELFGWGLASFLPPVVLGAVVLVFVATTRFSRPLRFATVVLFGLSTLIGCQEPARDIDPAWRAKAAEPFNAVAGLIGIKG